MQNNHRADSQSQATEARLSDSLRFSRMFPEGLPDGLEIDGALEQIWPDNPDKVTAELINSIIEGKTYRMSVLFWKLLGDTQKVLSSNISNDERDSLIENMIYYAQFATPEVWLQPWQRIADASFGSSTPAMVTLNMISLAPASAGILVFLHHLVPILSSEFLVAWHSHILQYPEGLPSHLPTPNESNIIIGLSSLLSFHPQITILTEIFSHLREKITLRALLADMKGYQYEGGNALRKLLLSLANNISNHSLFKTISYFVLKIPPTAFGTKMVDGTMPGDTLLFLLIYTFTLDAAASEAKNILKTVVERAHPAVFDTVITGGNYIGRTPLSLLVERYFQSANKAELLASVKIAIEKSSFDSIIRQSYPTVPRVLDLLITELNNPSAYPAILEIFALVCKKEDAHFKRESALLLPLLDAVSKDPENKKLANILEFVVKNSDTEIWLSKNSPTGIIPLDCLSELYLNHSQCAVLMKILYKLMDEHSYGERIFNGLFSKSLSKPNALLQANRILLQICTKNASQAKKLVQTRSEVQKSELFSLLLAEMEPKSPVTQAEITLLKLLAEAIPLSFWDSQMDAHVKKEATASASARNKKANSNITLLFIVINALEKSLAGVNPAWTKLLFGICVDLKNRFKKEPEATIWEPRIGVDQRNPVHDLTRIALTQIQDPTWVDFISDLIAIVPKKTLTDLPLFCESPQNSDGLQKITLAYQKRVQKPLAAVKKLKTNELKDQPSLSVTKNNCSTSNNPSVIDKAPDESQSKITAVHAQLEPLLTKSTVHTPPCSIDHAICSTAVSTHETITSATLIAMLLQITMEPENPKPLEVVSNWMSTKKITTEVWLNENTSLPSRVVLVQDSPLIQLINLLQSEPPTPNYALYRLISEVVQTIPAEKWSGVTYNVSAHNHRTHFSYLLECIVYRTTLDGEILRLLNTALQHIASNKAAWYNGLLYRERLLDHPLRMLMIIIRRSQSLLLLNSVTGIHQKIPAELWNIGGIGPESPNTPLHILMLLRTISDLPIERALSSAAGNLLHYIRQCIAEQKATTLRIPENSQQRMARQWTSSMFQQPPSLGGVEARSESPEQKMT